MGLLLLVELLFSSRWWPPEANPLTDNAHQRFVTVQSTPDNQSANRPSLKDLVTASPRAPIWFAPYGTYPEPGMLESLYRRGVYDTFLAVPDSGPVVINYGAPKLTPADTIFSLASAQGLGAEWNLARDLGYRRFALDLGAVTQPEAAAALCQSPTRCTLSRDGYALFVIPATGQGDTQLDKQLAQLHRRNPLLPYQSAGASWGPLVFNPFQWRVVPPKQQQAYGRELRLRVKALPGLKSWEIYRYTPEQVPKTVVPLLGLRPDDVTLHLPTGLSAIRLCPSATEHGCQTIAVNNRTQSLAIGDHLRAGSINRIVLPPGQRESRQGDAVEIELQLGPAAQKLLTGREHVEQSLQGHQPQVLP